MTGVQRDAVSTSTNAVISTAESCALSQSVRCVEWHTYIMSPHMPLGVYNFQGRASFIDVLVWGRKTGQGMFGAPLPASTSLPF